MTRFEGHEVGVPGSRVAAARWIYVGDKPEVFRDWLKEFERAHTQTRIQGFVVDLSQGAIWAALDMSDVSQDVWNDIWLRVVDHGDDSQIKDNNAVRAFNRLVRRFDPTTASISVQLKFDGEQWKQLAEVCVKFSDTVGCARQPTATSSDSPD